MNKEIKLSVEQKSKIQERLEKISYVPKRPGKNATDTQRQNWKDYLKIETKTQRTKRIFDPRMIIILTKINNLSKMAKSQVYTFDHEQTENILGTLQESLNGLADTLEGTTKEKIEFDL